MPTDVTILLFVGSVVERKGVDLLVRAFSEVSAECPGLYLLIVGPHTKRENPSLDEEFVHALEARLRKDQLDGQVQFLGLVQDRSVLADLFRSADIFVFPSRREGLGNVVLEAMATRLPVIASQLPVLEKRARLPGVDC